MIIFRTGSASHVGRVRSVNQDFHYESMELCIVADGMGGAAAGDVASRLAVETLAATFAQRSATAGAMHAGIDAANAVVYEASLNTLEYAGMGTTITAFAPVADPDLGDHVVIANVGDSRCYLYTNGELRLITNDHSVAAEMVRNGELTPAQAAVHPQRHMLTRALGVEAEVAVDIFELPLAAGDRLLLCSDGLSNEVESVAIASVLGDLTDPVAAAGALIELALLAGGHDNVTALVIDVLVGDATASTRNLDAIAPLAGALSTPPAANDLTGSVPAITELAPLTDATTTVAAASVAASAAPSARSIPDGAPAIKHPRLITVRTVLFVAAAFAIIYTGFRFVEWFASSQYYVTTSGSAIVIYQGQPGGTLWVQPKLVRTSATTTAEILPSRLADLAVGVPEPSISAATTYISNLVLEYSAAKNPGTVVTTTTAPVWTPQPTTTSVTSTSQATTSTTTSTTSPSTTTLSTTTTAPTTTTAAG